MGIGDIQRWNGFSVPSPSMLRLLLEREGYIVSQWSEKLGAYYGWHTHGEEQIHWVVSGELELTVQIAGQNHTYTLKSGDRDLMKPNTLHSARVTGTTDLFYLIGIKRPVEVPKPVEVAPEPKKTKAKTAKAKVTKAKSTKPKSTVTRKKKSKKDE